MYAERERNEIFKPVKLPQVTEQRKSELQSLILQKSEQDLHELKKYVNQIGQGSMKKQNYRLFRNIDQVMAKHQTIEHYKLNRFQPLASPDNVKLDPMRIGEQQGLGMIPRKQYLAHDIVAGYDSLKQPPAIDINPDPVCKVEYYR